MIFESERVAVFLDGCYWHECPEHCPDSFRGKNRERDERDTQLLAERGWLVLRLWEHDQLLPFVDLVVATVQRREAGRGNASTQTVDASEGEIASHPVPAPRTPRRKGNTPVVVVRIEPADWARFKEVLEAHGEGMNRNRWLVDAIRWCNGAPGAEMPRRPDPVEGV